MDSNYESSEDGATSPSCSSTPPPPRSAGKKRKRKYPSSQTSEGSNSNKAFRRGAKKAKFKLLFSSASAAKKNKYTTTRGALGVTAIQIIESTSEKAQDPIIVQPISNELYEPGELDDKIKNSKYWTRVRSMMKDILPLTADEDDCHWIWDDSKPFESFKYQMDMMEKKYCPVVHRSVCRDALSVLKGFLTTPTLTNPIGRVALHSIFNLCVETLDSSEYNRCHPMNLSGGALGYEGSCTFARYDEAEDDCKSNREAAAFLARCVVNEKTPIVTSCRVPDGQIVFNNKEGGFPITAKVKSGTDCQEFNLQTWLQALIGLSESDTSYVVLLAPYEGRIFKLSINEPKSRETNYRKLRTSSKTWCLTDDNMNFNVNKLLEFMEAVIDVLITVNTR